MIRSYLLIAFRNLWRNKAYSILNISGLGLGIAIFVFILQYLHFEYSVNRFHQKLPRLYRVLMEVSFTGKTLTWTSLPPGVAPLAKDKFSEVTDYCRMITGGTGSGIVTRSGSQNTYLQAFREPNTAYADASFFTMFSFPVLQGTTGCLKDPNTVAISERYAVKYFGKEAPVGKTLSLNNQFGKTTYTVSAVYRDFPENSDLQFDMIFSLKTLENPANLNGNDWARLDNFNSQYIDTYFLLKEGANSKLLEQSINTFKKQTDPNAEELFRLQPLANIHLASSLSDYYVTNGNLGFVYVMAGVALLILGIAWFNYINLSTAASLKRAKEVGVRKVVGASRMQLINQFLGESFLFNVFGFVVALVLVMLLQSVYNAIIGKKLSLAMLSESWFWMRGASLLVTGSLLSGAYTAFSLSSFKPTQTLKGVFAKSGHGILLRKFLVVFQFSISIAMITATFIIFQQLQFMQQKKLGFNPEQIVSFQPENIAQDSLYGKKVRFLREELARLSFVKSVSHSGVLPGRGTNFGTQGITRLSPDKDDAKKNYSIAIVDEYYFPTLEIPFATGKNFSATDCERVWDRVDRLILNETAVSKLGFTSPEAALHQRLKWGDTKTYEIVGVIKNYHHQSLQKAIEPIVFVPQHSGTTFLAKINTQNIVQNMKTLEKMFKETFPGNPFDYVFADENYNKQYQTEILYSRLFTIASTLAIFIGCLGLFGLAMFSVEQKTKEIGIRKVLGASVSQIVTLLSKDFLRLVLLAFVIATPLAWYVMNKWLQDFAYRIDLQWWFFALAGSSALLIALLTVSFQAIKAALANPVKSLRTE
jgi:putative ABC transport system permease protein